MERKFFQAISLWLYCRLAGVDDSHSHRDKFGALLGELDWGVEAKLILEEWRNGNQASNRSQEAGIAA